MVLIFDMDDTLYDEETYVRSGFRAVAQHLSSRFMVPAVELENEMLELLASVGRGRVFDIVLERHGHLTARLVRECIGVYRCHEPTIQLHEAGRECLHRFRQLPLYVATDGNKTAQAAKVRALGLQRLVRDVFILHRYGLRHAKPSPYCFQKIQAIEHQPPERIVYVGDNPSKDFVGIRPLGFRTVRVLTGPHAALEARSGYDAELTITSLNDLTPSLLKRLESDIGKP
jgi:putative hydrolase of the HAD superfamily